MPAQPPEMLTAHPSDVMKAMAAKVALRQSLQNAQHLATCVLTAVGGVQAEAVRSRCFASMYSMPAPPPTLPPHAADGRLCGAVGTAGVHMAATATPSSAGDVLREQRSVAARAVHASLHAELAALEKMHLLLNDRSALQCTLAGRDDGAAALLLERAKACRGTLERLRQALQGDFASVGASGGNEVCCHTPY